MGDTRSSGEQTQNASGENLGPAGGSCQTAGACGGFASERGTRGRYQASRESALLERAGEVPSQG